MNRRTPTLPPDELAFRSGWRRRGNEFEIHTVLVCSVRRRTRRFAHTLACVDKEVGAMRFMAKGSRYRRLFVSQSHHGVDKGSPSCG